MSANVYGIEGEFRQFTPSEVGLVIKVCRKSMGLKREVLAAFARVTDKTIQRAESGERVCEKSSQRIATALGLAQDTFTMHRFIPHLASPEVSQRHERQLNEAWAQTHLAVTVRELRDVRDVLPLLTTDAFWVDATNVADAHRQRFAALQQMVTEANDQAAEVVLSRIQELEARGYVIKGTVIEAYISDRPFQTPSKWQCSYVVAFQRSKGVKDTTPVEGWLSKMRLLKLRGVVDANQYPGDESTVWTGRDALGILCGDASTNHEAL
jgi:transcriptional regulator with XRE-family HTH domain